MKSNLHVIEVRAPVYRAAMILGADYPDDPPIAASEWLMESLARAGNGSKTRIWRAV